MKNRWIISLISLSLLNTLAINKYLSYQEIIIGFIAFLPVLCLYYLINKKRKNIFELTSFKLINIIITLFYLVVFSFLLTRCIFSYLDFIKNIDLISKGVLEVFISLIILGILGLKVYKKLSYGLFFIVGIMTVLFILLSIEIKIDNLLPIVNNKSFNGFYLYLELFFILIYSNVNFKGVINGISIGTILILIYSIWPMGLLGGKIVYNIDYPLYMGFSAIDFAEFFSRIESLSIIVFLSATLIKMTCFMDGIKIGLSSFKMKEKYIYIILFLIMIFGYFNKIVLQNWYIIVYAVIVPFIGLLFSFRRN